MRRSFFSPTPLNVADLYGGPREHLADSTLLYVLFSELLHAKGSAHVLAPVDRYRSLADPTRYMTVPGRLFFDFGMAVYEAWGPEKLFRTVAGAFMNQWTPASTIFTTARDAAQVGRRVEALERLVGRSCVSEIAIVADNAVTVRRLLIRPDVALTASQSIMYWSYIAAAFKAAGYEGIRLGTGTRAIWANEHLNTEALDEVRSSERMLLSWEKRQVVSACVIPRLRVADNNSLVNDLVRFMWRAISANRQVSIAEAASVVCRSERTLERRLHEANVSLRQLRLALQLSITSRLLAGPHRDLTHIAGAAGFSDVSHLIHRFRRATAMTPREFNRRLIK